MQDQLNHGYILIIFQQNEDVAQETFQILQDFLRNAEGKVG